MYSNSVEIIIKTYDNVTCIECLSYLVHVT